MKTCEKLPDGRTLIRQEICGKDVTLIFAVEQQADVLPHVTELIMAAYAALLRDNTDKTTVQKIRDYYNEFLGWANEFDLASIQRKRTILAHLLEKVELGKGYKVTIHLRMDYQQFLRITQEP